MFILIFLKQNNTYFLKQKLSFLWAITLLILQLLGMNFVECGRKSGGYKHVGNGVYQGPKGGEFHINRNGRRTYL
jgi:hypothetical protein